MLRLSPTEAIQFVKSGHDMVGTVDITNIVQHPVTYKIKTTSPDKFRVRPSSGVLAPGANNSINVVLLQGPNNAQSTLVKDKFLVMCMELSPDASTSAQDITELWKVGRSFFCKWMMFVFNLNPRFSISVCRTRPAAALRWSSIVSSAGRPVERPLTPRRWALATVRWP